MHFQNVSLYSNCNFSLENEQYFDIHIKLLKSVIQQGITIFYHPSLIFYQAVTKIYQLQIKEREILFKK